MLDRAKSGRSLLARKVSGLPQSCPSLYPFGFIQKRNYARGDDSTCPLSTRGYRFS